MCGSVRYKSVPHICMPNDVLLFLKKKKRRFRFIGATAKSRPQVQESVFPSVKE
jgi:hypothetical protein